LQQFRPARGRGDDQAKPSTADNDRQRRSAEIQSKLRANSQRIDVSCYLIGEIMASIRYFAKARKNAGGGVSRPR
jgi:hypothetical protein